MPVSAASERVCYNADGCGTDDGKLIEMRTFSHHRHPDLLVAPGRARHWTRWLGQNWARLSYAVRVEPTWLELNRWHLPIVGLNSSLVGYRVVQLSDLHRGRGVTKEHVSEAVLIAQAEEADLIVLTGDFVHKGFRYVERAARELRSLKAPDGVYAVLGNHDYSIRNALGIRRYRHLHHAVERALTEA